MYRVILVFLVLLHFHAGCMESYVTSDFGSSSGIHISRRHFECIDSTHTYSKNTELVSAKEPGEWMLITTNRQTAGVGTHSRKWLSEYPGNIYANLVMPILSQQGIIPFSLLPQEKIGALAVVNTFRHLLPNGAIKIKWPNDVVVNEKKLCGIMAEMSVYPWQLTIGIGVNINLDSDKLRMISQPATSMRESVGREFSDAEIENFLKSIVDDIVYMTKTNKTSGGIDVQDAFMENMEMFSGRFVSVFDDNTQQTIVGTIEGIDETGKLLLRERDSGHIINVSSGTLRSIIE